MENINFLSLIINKTILTKCKGQMLYNVTLLRVILSRAIDSLSAILLFILSSQLISKLFVSLYIQGLHKSSHEGIGRTGRQQKKGG